MSIFHWFAEQKFDPEIVVVLQDQQATWLLYDQGQLVDTSVEQIEENWASGPSLCHWTRPTAEAPELRVHLILDSSLDEVDRVKANTLSMGWLGLLQRRRLKYRLHREYPLADVHLLPAYAKPDELSIVHHLIPENWKTWLIKLQEQNICFSHVATGLELLCQWSCRRHPESLVESRWKREESGGAVLIDFPVGDESRHLLVDSGVPLLLRLLSDGVDLIDKQTQTHTRQQTLAYVQQHITHQEQLPPVLLPMTEEALSSNVQFAEADRNKAAQVLANMFFAVKRRSWKLTADHALGVDVLGYSIGRNRQKKRISQLQKTIVVFVWIAAATVLLVSVHSVGSVRERLQLTEQQSELLARISRLSDSVATMNEEPEFLTHSIEWIRQHQQIKPLEPVEVLTTLARAITEFPSLELEGISWVVSGENASDDVHYTSALQVAQREQIWQSGSNRSRIQVEIRGTVLREISLREQQQALESFVGYLKSMPGVASVSVLESPVSFSRSSDVSIGSDPVYRLALMLGAS